MAAGKRTIEIEIVGDSKKFGRSMDNATGKGGKFAAGAKRVGLAAGKVLAGGIVAATVAGVKFVRQAEESIQIDKQTEAVLKSTGGAANVTAKDVDVLSNAIQKKTGISDEEIQKSSNMLLTFTKVRNEVGKGNDVFTRATKTATDMGVAMGTDGTQAAKQLGKALNDPIKGVTALGRAGVQFTAQQKKQIETLVKSGDTLGAQKIILKELDTQFGGSAEAQATATGKMKAALGDFTEKIGRALLPAYNAVLAAGQRFVEGMTNGTGAGGKFREIVIAFGAKLADLGKTILSVSKFLVDHRAVIGAVVGGLATAKAAALAYNAGAAAAAFATGGWTVKFAALNAAMRANPVGAVITVVAGLSAAIIYAYQKSDTFRDAVDALGSAMKTVLVGGIKAATGALDKFLGGISTVISAVSRLPGMGWLKPAAESIDRAREKLRGFAGDLQREDGKTVNSFINVHRREYGKNPGGHGPGARDKYARGTNFARGGLSLVGEEGPELVQMPRGAKVHTARETAGMAAGGAGGGTTINFNGPVGSQRAARVAAARISHEIAYA